jgi:hypothetical protein
MLGLKYRSLDVFSDVQLYKTFYDLWKVNKKPMSISKAEGSNSG